MAKRDTTDLTRESSLGKLNATWAAIIAGCSIFGFGYGAASIVSNIFHKIEINEINLKHFEQLYFQKKEFDLKIEELTHENQLLEIENGESRKK
ncbi:MAG: hypothetical protein JNM51_07865 [Bacteroidia bacterium]|nr:hypothetical protein [Bacteroidia bacterium]